MINGPIGREFEAIGLLITGRALDQQIAALTALRDGLESCIGCGCLSLRRCAIAHPDDIAASAGPGAAYLPVPLRPPRQPAELAKPSTT